jgi:hypothetical protein
MMKTDNKEGMNDKGKGKEEGEEAKKKEGKDRAMEVTFGTPYYREDAEIKCPHCKKKICVTFTSMSYYGDDDIFLMYYAKSFETIDKRLKREMKEVFGGDDDASDNVGDGSDNDNDD